MRLPNCSFVVVVAALQTAVWAPKPKTTPAYPSGIKPWVKLADIKSRHKGDANWREVVVDDGRLNGEYVSAAPGLKVGRVRES